jgi:NAD+ kinase
MDNISTQRSFKHIGLIGKINGTDLSSSLKKIIAVVQQLGAKITLEKNTASLLTDCAISVAEISDMLSCDLIIVIGGDGTMLHVASHFINAKIPILGINQGRLGFLTDLHPVNLTEQLKGILQGQYILDERFLLELSIRDVSGNLVVTEQVINDVVIHSGDKLKLMDFELYVDDRFVYQQRADGLILATPTGSTAYALSAGGSIVDTKINAINIVPICPHNLSSRPMMVDGDSAVMVNIMRSHSDTYQPLVSCDGKTQFNIEHGYQLSIHKSSNSLLLVHLPDYDYYQICRSKLSWSRKLGKSVY